MPQLSASTITGEWEIKPEHMDKVDWKKGIRLDKTRHVCCLCGERIELIELPVFDTASKADRMAVFHPNCYKRIVNKKKKLSPKPIPKGTP